MVSEHQSRHHLKSSYKYVDIIIDFKKEKEKLSATFHSFIIFFLLWFWYLGFP